MNDDFKYINIQLMNQNCKLLLFLAFAILSLSQTESWNNGDKPYYCSSDNEPVNSY